MKVLRFEPTPNPEAMKFVVDDLPLKGGSVSYGGPMEADGDPLGTALFALGKVQSLFYMPGFITVTKTPDVSWSVVAPMVARTIELADAPTRLGGEAVVMEGDNGAVMGRIRKVLDEQILPILAGDGGSLEVVGLEGKTLTIRYQGACGSCPSSTSGTLSAIQALLQAEVDGDMQVVPAAA